MHGGLFSSDEVTLDDIRKIDRNRQPPEEGENNDQHSSRKGHCHSLLASPIIGMNTYDVRLFCTANNSLNECTKVLMSRW